jgi:hypothetical protein
MIKKEFSYSYMCVKKGKLGKEGPSGPYGIKGAAGLYFVQFIFVLIFVIVGPPGPSGNDGLSGGELMSKKTNVEIICFFFFAESGRNGYPGPKGERGDHGINGPNVNNRQYTFLNSHCNFIVDLWKQTCTTTSWTTGLSCMYYMFIVAARF